MLTATTLTTAATVGAVLLGITVVILLIRRLRHPKCPACRERALGIVPIFERRGLPFYICKSCGLIMAWDDIHPRRGN